MTIHFAAARSTSRSPVARALAQRAVRRAANDNPGGACAAEAHLLHAALRHFGEHGLRAAEEAAALAESAFRAREMQAAEWWIEVCRKLDGRLAKQLRERLCLLA